MSGLSEKKNIKIINYLNLDRLKSHYISTKEAGACLVGRMVVAHFPSLHSS